MRKTQAGICKIAISMAIKTGNECSGGHLTREQLELNVSDVFSHLLTMRVL